MAKVISAKTLYTKTAEYTTYTTSDVTIQKYPQCFQSRP